MGAPVLSAIARALDLPVEIVYRTAGLLPEEQDIDEAKARFNYILSQLPPDKRDELLGIAMLFYERERRKPEPRTVAKPAEG